MPAGLADTDQGLVGASAFVSADAVENFLMVADDTIPGPGPPISQTPQFCP